MLFRRHWLDFFLSNFALSLWDNIVQGFSCGMLSHEQGIKAILYMIFLCNFVRSLLGNIAQSFDLCHVIPRVLSIKTRFNKVFSYAMLSGASKTILHRILTCAMLYRMYKDYTEQDFFLSIVVQSLKTNIAQGFYLCKLSQEY